MSSPGSGADPELRARLEELLAQARDSGLAAEIAPLLRRFLEAQAGLTAGASPGDDDVPMRFGMVGASPKMEAVFRLLEKVKETDVAVLIEGETGTGKELVARALHEHGRRAGGPFLAENCAAIPAPLLESELFGHKKGAFTGAIADRPGHFAAADGGTIFLDEIGDMPLEMQAKLLRVVEQSEVRPVGASRPVKVDVRIIAATNSDLPGMVREGAFREDLYYRLNVVRIPLPPLRERPGDVELLVRFYMRRIGAELGLAEVEASPEALEVLSGWSWPGNVRELENELRRAMTLFGGRIEPANLSPSLSKGL
ncbi:MAG: sigma 54-interacting transcriptional regulator [Planctomycetota bacterium]|nr:sigma 54-interacting transcriptional regulator [Planctomycetota bacterium]